MLLECRRDIWVQISKHPALSLSTSAAIGPFVGSAISRANKLQGVREEEDEEEEGEEGKK